MIGKDMSSAAVAAYTDSDVATYLSGNGYDTATNIISTITDSAPATLDTLNELAAALGDDANFAGTVTTSLAAKANTADLATVATSGSYNDLTDQPVIAAAGGSFEAVASGTLANGDTVIINADGTISAYVESAATTPLTSGVSCEVIAAPPRTVNWAYVVVNEKALYDGGNSVDFNLHRSEETNLVVKILELAGITINKPGLVQIASNEETQNIQQTK